MVHGYFTESFAVIQSARTGEHSGRKTFASGNSADGHSSEYCAGFYLDCNYNDYRKMCNELLVSDS